MIRIIFYEEGYCEIKATLIRIYGFFSDLDDEETVLWDRVDLIQRSSIGVLNCLFILTKRFINGSSQFRIYCDFQILLSIIIKF